MTLVGEIVEVVENPTSVLYRIDDRTGPLVDVRKWISEEVYRAHKSTCIYMCGLPVCSQWFELQMLERTKYRTVGKFGQ